MEIQSRGRERGEKVRQNIEQRGKPGAKREARMQDGKDPEWRHTERNPVKKKRRGGEGAKT